MENLEKQVLSQAKIAIGESINSVLSRHDSPLKVIVKSVIDSHNDELREMIDGAFTQVIRTEEFKASIVSAFSHKVSRTIISNNDGLFDKVSNELKQSSIFKAKMTMAVSNVVEECLKEGH